jgi:hypothetical protein
MMDKDKSLLKRPCAQIFLGISSLIVVLLGVSLGIVTTVVNANLNSEVRFCVHATPTVSGLGGELLGELTFKSSAEEIGWRLQYTNLTSAVLSVTIHGKLSPGAVNTVDIAATLCGPSGTCLACPATPNLIEGILAHEKCDDATALGGVIAAIREQPSSYYLQINTGLYSTGNGELKAYLINTCGLPV